MCETPGRSASRFAAWSVHVLTASGVVWALLALLAIGEARYQAALGWMALALAVDGLDGPLARRFAVARRLPSVDGTLLDNLADYLNYVFVPAFLMHQAGLLSESVSLVAASTVCIASAFQFIHVQAKTDGRYFRGFPSYWNVVAYYLLLLRLPPGTGLTIVAVFCVLIFVPILYVHPIRTPRLRRLTLALTCLWAAALVALGLRYPSHPSWLTYGSMLYLAYYFLLSLWVTVRHRNRAA